MKVAELPLVLSSKGFNLMYHPYGTTYLHGAPAKPKHISLVRNVNYFGFFRKHIRSTLVTLPFCMLSKTIWTREKRGGESSFLHAVCFRFLLKFSVLWFSHSNFHVTVQAYMLLPTFMSLHILVTSPVCMCICIQLSIWRPDWKGISRETFQSNFTHSEDVFTQSLLTPM